MEQQVATNAVTTRTAGIRYGLISAVVGIAYFLILNIAGIDTTQGVWSIGNYIVLVAFIVLAQKYFKDNNGGFMSYGEGLGVGFWLGLVSSAIGSIFTYIYIKFVDTGFMDMIKEKQIEALEKQGMSEEQIDQAMKIAGSFMSPEMMLIFGLIGGIIASLIIALIVTIFTQKKNPEPTF